MRMVCANDMCRRSVGVVCAGVRMVCYEERCTMRCKIVLMGCMCVIGSMKRKQKMERGNPAFIEIQTPMLSHHQIYFFLNTRMNTGIQKQ